MTVDPGAVPLANLVPTMRYDAQLVIESEGTLSTFAAVRIDVLLLGGSRSPAYLKNTLTALAGVLPHARRVTLPGVGHTAPDNGGTPHLVAEELRIFFAESA